MSDILISWSFVAKIIIDVFDRPINIKEILIKLLRNSMIIGLLKREPLLVFAHFFLRKKKVEENLIYYFLN